MRNPTVIGLTGGTCAGKTSLANEVIEALRLQKYSTTYFSQDWYYRDLSHLPKDQRDYVNFDQPGALDIDLFDLHLGQLRSGSQVFSPVYDYINHVRLENMRLVSPSEIIVVDGLFLLLEEHRRKMIDISAFVSAPDDIRLIRRIRRDVLGCGFSVEYVLDVWERMTRPMHELYVAPVAEFADYRFSYWGNEPEVLETLSNCITEESWQQRLNY